ncbi:MAG: SDR family oxidoreductase [Rhodospirillaceae bacterium]|nr:MAG: SDR family oxidoreductase [Rhodospirillaceae bacterium]
MSKIIVITGAGEGLGRALARRFAADGDNVVLLGRRLAKLEAVVAELGDRAMAVACDVSSPESVKTAFAAIAKRHPRIDVLINNAAIYDPFLVAEATDDQILTAIGTNLTGPILCTRAVIPMMGRGSHIINVGSESVEMVYPFLTLYQSAKAGLERFSRALYSELEPHGIRVTMIRAGQMLDADKTWSGDPAVWGRFRDAALAVGLDLAKRPISQVASVTGIFRAVIDFPQDLQAAEVSLHAWASK